MLTLIELQTRKRTHIRRYNRLTPFTEPWHTERNQARRYERLYIAMLATNPAARRADTAERRANEHHRRAEVAESRWRDAVQLEEYKQAKAWRELRDEEREIRNRYHRVEAAANRRAYITEAAIRESDAEEHAIRERYRELFRAAAERREQDAKDALSNA